MCPPVSDSPPWPCHAVCWPRCTDSPGRSTASPGHPTQVGTWHTRLRSTTSPSPSRPARPPRQRNRHPRMVRGRIRDARSPRVPTRLSPGRGIRPMSARRARSSRLAGLALRYDRSPAPTAPCCGPGPTTPTDPTVLLCNGLGTNPYAWPALLDPDCGVRVISWNHRGVGGSARPTDPDRVGQEVFVEDALAVLDDAGVDACAVVGLVDRREHHVRARGHPSRARHRDSSPSPASPARRSRRWVRRCSSPASRASRSRPPSPGCWASPASRCTR